MTTFPCAHTTTKILAVLWLLLLLLQGFSTFFSCMCVCVIDISLLFYTPQFLQCLWVLLGAPCVYFIK